MLHHIIERRHLYDNGQEQETSYETSRILNINTTTEEKQLSTIQTTQNVNNKKTSKSGKNPIYLFLLVFTQKEKFNMNPYHYGIENTFQIVSKL